MKDFCIFVVVFFVLAITTIGSATWALQNNNHVPITLIFLVSLVCLFICILLRNVKRIGKTIGGISIISLCLILISMSLGFYHSHKHNLKKERKVAIAVQKSAHKYLQIIKWSWKTDLLTEFTV